MLDRKVAVDVALASASQGRVRHATRHEQMDRAPNESEKGEAMNAAGSSGESITYRHAIPVVTKGYDPARCVARIGRQG